MDKLPQDVIIDIFSRLPAKSIGKSRCVSKPWKSLLTQPQFIQTHIKYTQKFKSSEESLILVSNDSHSLYSVQFNNAHQVFDEMTVVATKLTFVDHLFESIKISGSGTAYCDGLILVGDVEKNFTLINPTTKEIKVLPSIPYAYDVRYCYPAYGIGYDSYSNDYKVVIIYCYNTSNVNEEECIEQIVNVYSVKNGTWKRAASSPYFHVECYGSWGVYANGYLHWVASRPADLSFVLAAFDLKDEKFHELVRPSEINDDESMSHRYNYVEMLGGCLSIQFFLSKGVADFWKMEEYGVQASWKRFTVTDVDEDQLIPVCFLQEERQVVLVKYEWIAHRRVIIVRLVLWDFEAKTFQDIVVDGIPGKFSAEWTYMESVVSPNPNCSINNNVVATD